MSTSSGPPDTSAAIISSSPVTTVALVARSLEAAKSLPLTHLVVGAGASRGPRHGASSKPQRPMGPGGDSQTP